MNEKRYHVSGRDEHDDIHTFSTDHLELAEEIMETMEEDLTNLKLVDSRGGGDTER
jgi:hypothetical protein